MNHLLTSVTAADQSRRSQAGHLAACIVTSELEGPFFNGGVGTANRGMALALSRLGYEVDILYTQVSAGTPFCLRGTFAEHVGSYAALGIRLLAIPNEAARTDWLARSYLVMQHLVARQYSIVFFDEMEGNGYYPLLARKTACPQLNSTAMCVTAHGGITWAMDLDHILALSQDNLALSETERRSVELADLVKWPSAYLKRKYASYGWPLPAPSVVMPNFVSERRGKSEALRRVRIRELVFFGRLESRKGIWLFLRAIDRLKFKLADHAVTFLGKARPDVAQFILQQSLRWPFEIRLLTDYNREQAISYMRGIGRLAVMPSPEDNSPSTILECMDEGIPFIATQGSGGEELIRADCRQANLCEPTVDGLAAKIEEALLHGGISAHHAFEEEGLERQFRDMLDDLVRRSIARLPSNPDGRTASPHVQILLVPDDYDMVEAADNILSLADSMEGALDIHAIARDDGTLRERLAGRSSTLAITVRQYGQMAVLLDEIAGGPDRIVGISHVGQQAQRGWFDRAAQCFAAGEISAITGMTIRPVMARSESGLRDSYFTAAPDTRIDRYLLGNSAPGLTLSLNSNSGFVFLRSALCVLAADVAPSDRQYDRSRLASDYIHELLGALTAAGHRFELVPDLTLAGASAEREREVSGVAQTIHRTADRLLHFPPGSDQWLLSRLAIDSATEVARRAESQRYKRQVEAILGSGMVNVDRFTSWETHAPELARLAHACGQPELAVDLMTRLSFGGPPFMSADSLVKAHAKTIELFDLIGGNHVQPINLVHDYSFKPISRTEIELHANGQGEGRAALAFTGIDLSGLNAFAATIVSQNARAFPIRIRLDVIAGDSSESGSTDLVVKANETKNLEMQISGNLQSIATVIIGLEMNDPRDPNADAWVHIRDARFFSRSDRS